MFAYRVISSVLIFALAAGSVAAQEISSDRSMWQKMAAALHPGTSVQVRLKDGNRIRGMIVTSSEESFVIKPATRIAVPPVSVAFSNVESIEPWREGLPPGVKVLLGVGTGVGLTMLVGLIALAAALD
jgi:hypothetical protein